MRNILSRIALAAVMFAAFAATTCQQVITHDITAEAPMLMYGNELIYASPNGLYAVDVNTSALRLVLASTVDDFDAIAIDGNVLFWVDSTRGRVRRINLTNGSVATMASHLASPVDISVGSNYVWVAVEGPGSKQSKVLRIEQYDADGDHNIHEKVTVADTSGGDNSISLVRKIADNRVVWADYGTGVIRIKNGDGSGSATTLAAGQCPSDMIFDASYLYWTNCDTTLRKVNLSGTPVVTIVSKATKIGAPERLVFDSTQNYIYFTTYDDVAEVGSLFMVSKNGDNWTPFSLARGESKLDGAVFGKRFGNDTIYSTCADGVIAIKG